MKRLPSIKSLREVFADRAPEARRILEMKRADLLAHPVGAARAAECYHAPDTFDLRMAILASLDSGLSGVEGFDVSRRSGEQATVHYLNAGDTYSPTIVLWGGAYRVESWGDRVETLERQGWTT
jgi:hypothetical protein